MKRVALLLVLVTPGCNPVERDAPDTPVETSAPASPPSAPPGAPSTDSSAPAFTVETVAESLQVPWGIAFAPDGRIFVTERLGSVRVIRNGVLQKEPWAAVKVTATGEAGLMGIALAPDFERSAHVYVVATFRTTDGLINRVLRFTEREAKGQDPVVILDSIPSARFHAGDAIAFGPDGMLYIATGDAMHPTHAHDVKSLAGKILRLNPDGTIPEDNPIPGSPVYAYGLRNTQGIAWDPETEQLFATEHGPSGFPNERFRRNHDELNAIQRGADHGWPSVAGNDRSAESVQPLADWDPAIAPAGLAVYTGTDFPRWHKSLFVGALRGAHLRRVSVEKDSTGWLATSEEIVVEGMGRIRAVAMGRDGHLYFTTSNQDGRGNPATNDDRLLRIVPTRP